MLSSGGISCSDLCLLSNIKEMGGASLDISVSFQESGPGEPTDLVVSTIFFSLSNYAEGNLLMLAMAFNSTYFCDMRRLQIAETRTKTIQVNKASWLRGDSSLFLDLRVNCPFK